MNYGLKNTHVSKSSQSTINPSSTKQSLHPYGPMASSYEAVHPSLT